MKFSVMFFSTTAENAESGGYELMIEIARMADAAGFTAIWTPERHFDAFGALFPNPALTSAALAMVTDHVQLRAGSVVSPLHDTLRLVEDWLVVDRLSSGRAAVSFASGWHPNDFVFAPNNFSDRAEIMFTQISEARELWRTRRARRMNPAGQLIDLTLHPAPVQANLPIWVTSGGNRRTFQRAGRVGANILTHLISQSVAQLAEQIRAYRDSLDASSETPGVVSLMLHTYIGDDIEAVRAEVREPMRRYLALAAQLVQTTLATEGDDDLPVDAIDEMLEIAFNRYLEQSSLLGTEDTLLRRLDQLEAIGVDEVACLVDFGLPSDRVLRSMERLCRLSQARCRPGVTSKGSAQC